ncbi:glutamate--tRNA ligase [Leptobacterium sp. I13]|uniref:glutamate--tRNA ligase n=1 Tax=Leptobacterium meishanense TaxID=3128904 RepID=UPI0030EC1435
MTQKVRVRFAPSPTGPLHIGGVRTALFNYLFAKSNKGSFILRIEDTDQNRYVEGAEDYIVKALKWCGISFDEGPNKKDPEVDYGPYRQSERTHIYKEHVGLLLEKGKAYYAFDTTEELDAHRKNHEKKGKTFVYNWHNRLKLTNSLSLSESEVAKKIAAGEPYVVRFKSPKGEKLFLNDLIRERIVIDTNVLDDKILFKSDGMPTYHLANVVDDYLMKITHVIRGEEWLPSLPLHVLLYDAFGWEKPQFAHLPLILKPSGSGKLSKRDGDKLGFPVFPLNWTDAEGNISKGYKEAGYFPEAVVNFLALLGWNPGTKQELFNMNELIKAFSIENINKSGARFDPEKIKWFNHQYFQTKSNEKLAEAFIPIVKQKSNNGISPYGLKDKDYITKVIALTKERATFINDLWGVADFFFIRPQKYDEKAVKKQWKADTPRIMEDLSILLKASTKFNSEYLEFLVKQWIQEKGFSFGQVMAPFRLALVGALKGPHVFDIASLLGKEETIGRIKNAVRVL